MLYLKKSAQPLTFPLCTKDAHTKATHDEGPETAMANENDDTVNRLIAGCGSVAERVRLAEKLDDEKLRIAAPYSPQAKEELTRRQQDRLLSAVQEQTTDSQIELRILQAYTDHHRAARIAQPDGHDKCALELDMREVIADITYICIT